MAKCTNCKNQLHWDDSKDKRLLMCRVCGKYYDVIGGKLIEYKERVVVVKPVIEKTVVESKVIRKKKNAK